MKTVKKETTTTTTITSNQEVNISRGYLTNKMQSSIRSCDSDIRRYEKYLIEAKAKRDAFAKLLGLVEDPTSPVVEIEPEPVVINHEGPKVIGKIDLDKFDKKQTVETGDKCWKCGEILHNTECSNGCDE